jgi:hypothetical protein
LEIDRHKHRRRRSTHRSPGDATLHQSVVRRRHLGVSHYGLFILSVREQSGPADASAGTRSPASASASSIQHRRRDLNAAQLFSLPPRLLVGVHSAHRTNYANAMRYAMMRCMAGQRRRLVRVVRCTWRVPTCPQPRRPPK